MASKNHITADYVRQALEYNQATGKFHWRERPVQHFQDGKQSAAHNRAAWNGKHAGMVAGTVYDGARIKITLDGRRYLAHRLAWLWMKGKWPADQIDHHDVDPSNNRWLNLREATNGQNAHNTRAHRDNTSGFKGVYWHKLAGKWQAQIMHNGKNIHIGLFDTREEAAAARAIISAKLHGEFARAA